MSNAKYLLKCDGDKETQFSFSAVKTYTGYNTKYDGVSTGNLWCAVCVRWGNHISSECPSVKDESLEKQEPIIMHDGTAKLLDEDLDDYLQNSDKKHFCCICDTYIPTARVHYLAKTINREEKHFNCVKCSYKLDKDLVYSGGNFELAIANLREKLDTKKIEETARMENEGGFAFGY